MCSWSDGAPIGGCSKTTSRATTADRAVQPRRAEGMIGPEQTRLLRDLFGSGMKGAEEAAENPSRPAGLTDEAIGAYRELANRAVSNYEQTGSAAAAALQKARLELLKRIDQ